MKVGDVYRLPCSHMGKIKMVLEDTVAVEGPVRGTRCFSCNPRRGHPTVFLISLREGKDPRVSK